jgi:RNA polymerase sigma factor (sigma-70 family)
VADAIAERWAAEPQDCPWSRRVRGARGEYREARERFVRAHLPLVAYFARRWGRRGMPFRDRVQEGTIGLLHATDRFDPERGVQFSTYAVWWIRHAITRAHTEHEPVVHVPERMRTTAAKTNRGTMRLRAELGREPSDVELAEAVGVTPERLRVSIAAAQIRVIGLDVPVAAGTSITAHDLLVDEDSVEGVARLTEKHDVELAVVALAQLDTRERAILRDRFGLDGESPTTFDNIAERLSLSRERVRQLQHRALAKLRYALEAGASVD